MRGIAALVALSAGLIVTVPAEAIPPGSTVLVSRPSAGPLPAGAVNRSEITGHGAVSEDGRHVVFNSDADALLATPSRYSQVFRLDRLSGVVTLVSATPGGAPGNGISGQASISADGTRVAYQSQAQNIVAGTNEFDDVFYRDLDAAGTSSSLVSRASNSIMTGPGQPGNNQSFAGQIAADGSAVQFVSTATNLHPDDTDPDNSVFVRQIGVLIPQTELLSRADGASGASTTESAGGGSISANGDVVSFSTQQAGLDPNVVDDNGAFDVFVRSRTSGETRMVSRSTSGTPGDGHSFGSVLAGAGTVVAFESDATNLAGDDQNGDTDVFRRANAFGAGATSLVSRVPGGAVQAGNGESRHAAIAAGGNVVTFTSAATDLLAGPDANGTRDVFARNVATGTTTLLTRDGTGAPASGAGGFELVLSAISRDGAIGVFSSDADSLTALDDDDHLGIYAAAVGGGPVSHLSRPPGLAGPFEGGVGEAQLSSRPISTDGRFVAFVSDSDAVSTVDDDRVRNAFVRDVFAGTTTLVSRASGVAGAAANGATSSVALSSDGTRAIFTSRATNLSPADPDIENDVYVRDLRTGVTTLVSRANGAAGAKANASSSGGSLDADGTRAVFSTDATNLGSGADAGLDVFVRDLVTGATLLASRADGANGVEANATAGTGSLNAAGTRVAFITDATNMGNGDADGTRDVHVRDLVTGRTILASRASGVAGAKSDGFSSEPMLDAAGTRVAFASHASNLGDGDVDTGQSAFVRDLAASTTRLVSRADGAAGASTPQLAIFVRISDDGNRVTFGSSGGDLTGEAPAGAPQTFLRDIAAGRTLLVSRGNGAAGPPLPVSNQFSGSALSGNGRCVAFAGSPAAGFSNPEYATSDFFQVYLRAVDGVCAPAPIPPPPGGGPAPDTTSPVISSLTMTRRTFAVGRRATPRVARTARGTAFRFRLSETATVRIAIARARPGRRNRGRCVKPRPSLRRARRCTRFVRTGALTRTALPAGANRVRFSGRIGRRALARGRYRARLVATDAAGNRSAARNVRFRVKRR